MFSLEPGQLIDQYGFRPVRKGLFDFLAHLLEVPECVQKFCVTICECLECVISSLTRMRVYISLYILFTGTGTGTGTGIGIGIGSMFRHWVAFGRIGSHALACGRMPSHALACGRILPHTVPSFFCRHFCIVRPFPFCLLESRQRVEAPLGIEPLVPTELLRRSVYLHSLIPPYQSAILCVSEFLHFL